MNIKAELSELVKDRWAQGTTTLSGILSILLAVQGKPNVFFLGLEVFVILLIVSNSIYILQAKKKEEKGILVLTVAGQYKEELAYKYPLLRPYAWRGLAVSVFVTFVSIAIPPFNRLPIDLLYGTNTPTTTLTPIPTRTPTLTPSPTITPLPTRMPEANSLYYLFILDASSKMTQGFDESETKWLDMKDKAKNRLIEDLIERANYGLIVLGGNLEGSTQTCNIKTQMTVPIEFDNQQHIIDSINRVKPGGVASLGSAIRLAREELLQLPGDVHKELFFFLGGGDDCDPDKWRRVLNFLEYYQSSLSGIHTELVILSDENMDPSVVEKLNAKVTMLGLQEQVGISAPASSQELQNVISEIQGESLDRARPFEPAAVAAQETQNVMSANAQSQPTPIVKSVQTSATPTASKPTSTPTSTLSATNTPRPVTTIAPSKTPTPTPTFIPTSTPYPTSPPTSTPNPTSTPTQIPTLPTLAVTYLPTSQTDVFSTGCPLINYARVFAQFSQGQAGISATIVPNGYTTQGLRLDFTNASVDGGNYAGWEVWLGANDQSGIDLSSYESLVFYIRGSAGAEELNVYLMMPIKDGKYPRHWEAVKSVTTFWQQVVIPLSYFSSSQAPDNPQVDLSNIPRIQILFEWYPQPTSGTIFIDDLCVQ